MTHRRLRDLCAAAVACAALAMAPASAGAHPGDGQCPITAGATTPTAGWFAGSGGCADAAVAAPGAGDSVAPRPKAVLASYTPEAAEAEPPGAFAQVGHEPLLNRGMNAAIAVRGDYAYIGSRTDAHDGTPHGGIMVVDISDPTAPRLRGRPFDMHAGESTRELRVWQSQDVLIVLNTNCGVGPTLHHCTQPSISNFRFYDIRGKNAAAPRLLNEFKVDTHEFFLWQDPRNPARALIFAGDAASTCATRGGAPSCPFSVWDISRIRTGKSPVTLFSGPHGYSAVPERQPTGALHSLTISNDGRTAYFALLTGGFAVVDVSEFAEGAAFPMPHSITVNEQRPGRARARTARSSCGAATGPGSRTRCTARPPRPVTAARGGGHG